jgi:hypothetical protein
VTEKTVEINIGGVPTKVKLVSMKTKVRNEALRKSMKKTGISGGSYEPEIDMISFNEWSVYYCIVEPATLKDPNAIGDLEPAEYDKLVVAVQSINEVSPLSKATSEVQ